MLDLAVAERVADVSGWQSWDLRPLRDDGFVAVIVKVSERLYASNNVQRQQALTALEAGMLLLGKYAFSVGGTDGAGECDVCVEQLADLPFHEVVMDAEASTMGPIPSVHEVIAFGERAHQLSANADPFLYASEWPMASLYNYVEIADLFRCWYAQYDDYAERRWPAHQPRASFPQFGTKIAGWQFTSTFPSRIGHVDASVFDPAALGGPAPVPPAPALPDFNAIATAIAARRGDTPMATVLYGDHEVTVFVDQNGNAKHTARTIALGQVVGPPNEVIVTNCDPARGVTLSVLGETLVLHVVGLADQQDKRITYVPGNPGHWLDNNNQPFPPPATA